MASSTYDEVVIVLTTKFRVDPGLIEPKTALLSLGLDSLSLMEFVFAIEDHFELRIPEDRLDPRQAELTLADVCQAIDEVILKRDASVPVAGAAPADS